MEEIYIEWSGPYSYEETINDDTFKKSGKLYFPVKPSDFGLYQIYGNHCVYGSDVLLYIGKTGQPFHKRLFERNVIVDNSDSQNVQIYLGKVYYDESVTQKHISEDISRSESLLIHSHKPAHNSASINSFKFSDDEFTVINTGSYRSLQHTVSTTAYTKELKVFKIIDILAQDFNEIEIYQEEDGYGFFINEEKTMWFGVDYDLWSLDTVFVLESEKKVKGFEAHPENGWYYKVIRGSEEEIRNILLDYR